MHTVTGFRLPDFIIGGAPKCGTTSLHHVLAQSGSVGIPEDEIHFFDADDPIAHPDFLFDGRDGLEWYDPRAGDGGALGWYAGQFARFAEKTAIGEDSTIYLQSEVAAARIRDTLPDVRLIFMLRDPVERAYSQYWHLITRGRARCSFETALTRHPSIILGSTYALHLRRYLDLFGQDRVRVGLFEDFLSDPQAFTDGITDYLGLPRHAVSQDRTWFNRTYYPTRPELQYLVNSVSARIAKSQYRNHFAQRAGPRERLRQKIHHHWFRRVHPILLKSEKKPPMRADTRAYLAQHLSARNHGLSAILDRDLADVWPGFSQ